MAQTTRVYKVSAAAAEELRARLNDGLPPDAEWRSVPHARFSVKSLGVVLTCYSSGKVVAQGSELDTFEQRFMDEAATLSVGSKSSSSSSDDATLSFDVETVGSDEAGKGDYFGPLVVAACAAGPTQLDALREIGVTDSKTLTDARAKRLAGLVESAFEHEVIVVDPQEYNPMHADCGNVNTMLATLHADAIQRVKARAPDVACAVVDRFARNAIVANALKARGLQSLELVEVPRAERHPVVAAASILARAAFLDGLDVCSERCGTDLHKGAGAPVDVVAQRVVDVGGRELLAQVAKLHFKNTKKIARG